MTGRLRPLSPWSRQAFTPIDKADIEGKIPDGLRIEVTCNAAHDRYRLRAYRGSVLLVEWGGRRSAVVAAHYLAERLHDPEFREGAA